MEIRKGIRKLHRSPSITGDQKKNIILGILLFVIIVTVVFFQLSKNFYSNIYTGKSGTPIKDKTQYSILLMGYGGGSHEGTYLTDTMMVITIDTKKEKSDTCLTSSRYLVKDTHRRRWPRQAQ